MSKNLLVSVVGGMLGAAALLGVVGGVLYVQNRLSVRLPILVNASSVGKSQIMIFAELVAAKGADQATLVIDSFKVAIPPNDLFNSVGALIPLPSSCLPISQPKDVPVKIYASNGVDLVDGILHMGLDGSIMISSSAQTVAGGAWGLAEVSRITFDIANK